MERFEQTPDEVVSTLQEEFIQVKETLVVVRVAKPSTESSAPATQDRPVLNEIQWDS